MKNQIFIGKGWIQVPEAKLGPGDEITGWVVKRDLWWFALYARVEIKIEATMANVSITHFCVTGTEAAVKTFHRIIKRAVDIHNAPRFRNMVVPVVTWDMTIKCRRPVTARK